MGLAAPSPVSIPKAEPAADLVALQRIIESRPTSPSAAPPPIAPPPAAPAAPATAVSSVSSASSFSSVVASSDSPAPVQRLPGEDLEPAPAPLEAAKSPAAAPATGDDPAGKAEKDAAARSHQVEIQQIVGLLDSDPNYPEIAPVLDILGRWDRTTITAAWATIGDGLLHRFVDNIAPEHIGRAPRVIAATYQALPLEERWETVKRLTAEDAFSSVTPFDATQVLYLIQGFPPAYLTQFVELDEGRPYRRFVETLPPSARVMLEKAVSREQEEKLRKQELDRRVTAGKEETVFASTVSPREDAAKRKTEAKRIGAEAQGSPPSDQLAAIERLLWTGISDWAVTRTEARQVFQIFRALSDDVALGGIVRRLEAKGLVDRWLRSMPEKELYERANGNVAVFIRILSFRPPDAAIKQAIKLLSYGLFDWAVRDAEAILAYHLIRSLPPDAQRDFKVRDNGKWFVRLERNLTQGVLTGREGYVGQDVKADQVGEGYGLAGGDNEKEVASATKERTEDSQILRSNPDTLTQIVSRVRTASAEKAPKVLSDLVDFAPAQVRAFVRHLDRLNLIEPLLNKIGTKSRFNAENAKKTLSVLGYRDPVYNIAQITDLLSYGLFDWEINKDEARLAYELIRALPAKERDDFIARDPLWFKRIDSNISLELRKSSQFGFYQGSEDSRDKLLGQLLDDRIWKPENLSHLAIVLHTIRQAGLVNEASPHVQARWTQENAGLLESLGYRQTGSPRPEVIIDKTDDSHLVRRGLNVAFVSSEKLASGLLSYAFLGRGEARGVKLDRVQDALGGHILGIEFGASTDTEKAKDKQDRGEVDFAIDEQRGLIQFKAQDLPISSVNVLSGGTSIRADQGLALGAAITVKWATTVDPRTFLAVDLGKFSITNLLFVQKDRIFGIGKIDLDGLALRGKRPTGDGEPVRTRTGLLADIGRVFYRIVQLLAGIVEALPIVGSIAPLNPLFDAGRGPGLAEQISEAFAKNFNLQLALGGLTISDVTDGRGGFIKKIELGKTDLDLALTPGRLPSEKQRQASADIRDRASIERRELTAAEQAQIASLEQQASAWQVKEQRRAELVRRRETPAGIDEAEKKELAQLGDEIDAASVTGKIGGALTFTGVERFAGVSAEELTLKAVTLGGELSGVAGIVGSALSKQGQAEALAAITSLDKPELSKRLGASALAVRAGEVTGKNITYESTVRRDVALKATIAALEKIGSDKITEEELTRLEAARRELRALQPQVDQYTELAAKFATLNPQEVQQFRQLEAFLNQPSSIKIAALSLTGAAISGNLAERGALFSAQDATLLGVEAGGVKIERVSGRALSLGVGGGAATLEAAQLSISGVKLAARIAELRMRAAELAKLKEARALTRDETAELQRIGGIDGKGLLQQYDEIVAEIAKLHARIAPLATDAPERVLLNNELERRKAELKSWESTAAAETIDIAGANLQVSGLGDVFQEGYSLPQSGLTLSASQKRAPLLGKLTARGLELDGKKVEDITLDRLDGKLRQLDQDTIQLDAVTLQSLDLKDLHVRAPDLEIDIDSPLQVKGLAVTATLTWGIEEQRFADGTLTGARSRKLKDIFIERLEIASIDVSRLSKGVGIHLKLKDSVEADLAAGTLQGIVVNGFRLSDKTFASVDVKSTDFVGLQKLTVAGIRASSGALHTGSIHVETLQTEGKRTGKLRVRLEDLAGDALAVDRPGLGITIRRLRGAKATDLIYDRDTGEVEIPELRINTLDVSRVQWSSGTKSLNIRKKLVASGIKVRGSYKIPKDLKTQNRQEEKPGGPEKRLYVDEMVIERADVEDTDYKDSAAGRDIKVKTGHLEDIRLSKFDLAAGTFGLHTGTTSVQLAKSAVTSGLALEGGLRLDALDIGILGTNHTTVKLRGLSTDDLEAALKDDKDLVVLKANFGGTRDVNGELEIEGKAIHLREIVLGRLRVSKLAWTDGAKSITSEGRVELDGVKLNADLSPDEGKKGSRKIEIPNLHIDRIFADSLKYSDKDSDIDIEIKQASEKEKGGDLSIVDVNLTNFSQSAAGTTGELKVSSLDAKAVGAKVGNKLKATASAHASGLSAKFAKEGRIIVEAKQAAGSFKVNPLKDGKETEDGISGTFANLATGEVTISPTAIEVPNLAIGDITVNRLKLSGPSLGVATRAGGYAALRGITANVSLDRKSGEIQVRSLVVPTTVVKGMNLAFGDFTLTFPDAPEGTLTNFHIDNLKIPEGAAGSSGVTGHIGIGDLNFKKLGARIGSTLDAKADLSASNLNIDLLGINGQSIKVAELHVNNVNAKVAGTGLQVGTSTVKGLAVGVDGSGKTSVQADEIVVGGIFLDSKLFYLRIDKATLPRGFRLPANKNQPVTVDELKIGESFFYIKDIPALSGDEKKKEEGSLLKDRKFLDTISGSVTANIHFQGSYGKATPWNRTGNHKLDLRVTNGVVDLARIEDGLSLLEDTAVDFQLRGDKLVLGINLAIPIRDLLTWDLSEEDKKFIERRYVGKDAHEVQTLKKIHLSTFSAPTLFTQVDEARLKLLREGYRNQTLTKAEAQELVKREVDEKKPERLKELKAKKQRASERSGSEKPEDSEAQRLLTKAEEEELEELLKQEFRVDALEISRIDADLGLKGPAIIDLGTHGTITLSGSGPDGVATVKAKGALSLKGTSVGLNVNLQALKATLDNFKIESPDRVLGTQGSLTVKKVRDVAVVFDHFSPKSVDGTIEEAVANDIRITLGDAVSKAQSEPKKPQ